MTRKKLIKDIWAEHTRCEFELKDAEATMETMTAQPSVNHVPTMTGGNGYEEVYHFYKHYFIPKLPQQIEITNVSCTVDDDRLVDELIFRFVHDSEIAFMLPNLEPTGKTIAVPLVVIVYIEGEKVAKEHIYWDQATVLKQLGFLKEAKWPVMGVEQAAKILDPKIPSNLLLKSAKFA